MDWREEQEHVREVQRILSQREDEPGDNEKQVDVYYTTNSIAPEDAARIRQRAERIT